MALLRVLFLSTVIVSTMEQFRIDNYAREEQANLTKAFLRLYVGFSLIVHVENSTVFSTSYLLKLAHNNIFGDIVIFNRDTLMYTDIQKRMGSSFLHVVLLKDPNKFSSFLKMPGYIVSDDVVAFVLLNNEDAFKKKFWKMPRLDWAGNVVILSFFNNSASVYNVCYYCGEFTKKLRHLQSGNTTSVRFVKSHLLARNFSNFYKHRFKIGYVDSFPFFICDIYETSQQNGEITRICIHGSGLEMGILKILQEKLNFTYELHQYTYSLTKYDKDINKEGSVEIDFIIGGLTITAATAPKMSFTSTLAFEPITFLYIPRRSGYSELFDILKPFKHFLWISVIAATLCFTFSLYASIRIMNTLGCKMKLSLSKCFKICFKAIIEQADQLRLDLLKPYFSPCLILGVWWLASNILTTAYKSKLWAIYIKNYRIEPSNLQELLDNDYEIIVNSQNEDIIYDIFSASDPLILEAKRRLIIKEHTCPVVSYILNNKAAMLDEHATIQYHALVRCSQLLTPNVYSKLRITKTPLRHITHSWPLQMGAPYKYTFDTIIGRIESAGLQRKWKTDCLSVLRNKYDSIPYSQSNALEEGDEEEKFLQGFASALVLYFIGNFTALLCFIGELVCQRKLSKRKRL